MSDKNPFSLQKTKSFWLQYIYKKGVRVATLIRTTYFKWHMLIPKQGGGRRFIGKEYASPSECLRDYRRIMGHNPKPVFTNRTAKMYRQAKEEIEAGKIESFEDLLRVLPLSVIIEVLNIHPKRINGESNRANFMQLGEVIRLAAILNVEHQTLLSIFLAEKNPCRR